MKYLYVVVLLFSTALSAHAALGQGSEYLSDAERLLAKGELKAAEIQLKNAVRTDPQNMAAHYRLAVVQLQLGEAAAAEHEASVARAGGFDPDHTLPLLAESYLAQQKYRQVLDEFPATDGSNIERSGLLVARGYAQIGLGKPDEARQSFQAAETLSPNTAGPLLAEAKLLMSEHQFDSADPLFDRALKLDPKSTEARLGKARLLRFAGKPDEAQQKLDELVVDNPEFLPARIERAEISISQNKLDPAQADISAVLKSRPDNVAAIYLSTVIAVKHKDFEKADVNLQKISKALPSIGPGYYLQALVSYNLRRFDQAEDAARRYVARNPENLPGAKLLAAIELTMARPADAIETLSHFETDGKADAGTFDLLGRAYTQVGKTSEALAAFSAAVKLAPENAALRTQLGGVQLRAGHAEEAITDFEQSLDLQPSTPAAEMLVMTELSSGDWQHASDTVAKLRTAQPNSPVLGNLAGLIKLARFDLEGARTEFAEVTKKNPEFTPARLNLAKVLDLEGKADDAEGLLNDVLKAQPANAIVLTKVVDLLVRNGKGDAAVNAVESAHAAAPNNKGITSGLIELYIRLGKKEKALELARQESGENDRSNIPLIAARARAELAAGLPTEAASTYERLIQIAPERLDFRRQLAAARVAAGDIPAAEHAIDQALEAAPQNAQLATDRISLELKASGVEGAVGTAIRLRTKYPGLPSAPALEGDAYMAAGEYAKADDAYTKAFRETPSAMLAIRLAQAKSAAGSAEAAQTVLREWVKQHPDDTQVAETLATYDLAGHRFDDATKELEQLSAKFPQNAVALNNLAWLYQKNGDPRARSLAERAYLLAPNLPQAADTLGWILVQQGQAALAIGLLKQASETNATNLAIRYHLAVALNDVGKQADAVKLLSDVVSSPGTFDEKADAQKLLDKLSKG